MQKNEIETALEVRRETTDELATTSAQAEKQYEIQGAIILARRFPRNEDAAFERLQKACKRPTFAEDASYKFPRGKIQNERGEWVQNYVEGPSVYLAREAARIWGNIRYGLNVVRDDDTSRQIRGWAWDVESNAYVAAEDDFQKLIQRKVKGKTEWVHPDERDMRELTNRRGAVLVRNCILQILPADLIEDARALCYQTIEDKAAKDPDGERKRLIVSFSALNVTPAMLEEYVGHPLGQSSPAEIAGLRGVYKSIKDGNSTWAQVAGASKPPVPKIVRKSETRAAAAPAPAPAPENLDAEPSEPQGIPADALFDQEREAF